MKRKNIIFLVLICFIVIPPTIDLIIVRQKTPNIVGSLLKSDKCVLKIDNIPKERIDIILKIEDPTFFNNKGLDFSSPGAGFTTISQGLGKIIYFDNFKPGIRKVRLIILTRFALYPLVSKKDILTLFINYVYFGNYQGKEIRGFENAARIYYNKPFDSLTIDEFISLEAMLINPNQFSLFVNKDKNIERVARIKNFLSGNCKPENWRDDELNGCGS